VLKAIFKKIKRFFIKRFENNFPALKLVKNSWSGEGNNSKCISFGNSPHKPKMVSKISNCPYARNSEKLGLNNHTKENNFI